MAESIVTVSICVPKGYGTCLNLWLAQGVEPVELAKALSRFTQMRGLCLHNFDSEDNRQGCPAFLYYFAKHLWIQKLETLHMSNVEMEAADTALILRRHRKTLKTLHFDTLDVSSGVHPYMLGLELPWSDVFEAAKKIQNDCEVIILRPKEFGEETKMGIWHTWEPFYEYKGLIMDLDGDDEPESEDDESEIEADSFVDTTYLSCHIRPDAGWRKGVDRVNHFYRCALFNPLNPWRLLSPSQDNWSDNETQESPGWCRQCKCAGEEIDEQDEMAEELWDDEDKAKLQHCECVKCINLANEKT